MMRFPLIAFLLLVVGRASAQNDTIFPNVDGVWHTTTATWDWDGQNMNFLYYHIALQYHAQPSVEIDGLSWGSVTIDNGMQVGLIAVDQDKVFYRAVQPFGYGYGEYEDTTTQVLYDFGLEVNDTAYWQPSDVTMPVIVQSIDTVWFAGRPRKRLHFDSMGGDWIAGVGSTQGLLYPFQYVFEVIYTLDDFCGDYVDADSIAYHACFPLSMGVTNVPKKTLAVHPNPSVGNFILDAVSPNVPYRLMDIRGIEVLSGRTTGESTTIRIPNAAPGLYVLNLDGTRIKVIVQ